MHDHAMECSLCCEEDEPPEEQQDDQHQADIISQLLWLGGDHVVEQILLLLEYGDLVRCRLVCRAWHAFIADMFGQRRLRAAVEKGRGVYAWLHLRPKSGPDDVIVQPLDPLNPRRKRALFLSSASLSSSSSAASGQRLFVAKEKAVSVCDLDTGTRTKFPEDARITSSISDISATDRVLVIEYFDYDDYNVAYDVRSVSGLNRVSVVHSGAVSRALQTRHIVVAGNRILQVMSNITSGDLSIFGEQKRPQHKPSLSSSSSSSSLCSMSSSCEMATGTESAPAAITCLKLDQLACAKNGHVCGRREQFLVRCDPTADPQGNVRVLVCCMHGEAQLMTLKDNNTLEVRWRTSGLFHLTGCRVTIRGSAEFSARSVAVAVPGAVEVLAADSGARLASLAFREAAFGMHAISDRFSVLYLDDQPGVLHVTDLRHASCPRRVLHIPDVGAAFKVQSARVLFDRLLVLHVTTVAMVAADNVENDGDDAEEKKEQHDQRLVAFDLDSGHAHVTEPGLGAGHVRPVPALVHENGVIFQCAKTSHVLRANFKFPSLEEGLRHDHDDDDEGVMSM